MADDDLLTRNISTGDSAPDAGIRVLEVFNATANDLPGFALLRITGEDADGALTVGVPNADSQTGLLVNFPSVLPAGGYGQAHQDFPASVLFESGEGTPVVGQEWGAKAGDCKLHPGKKGYLIKAVGTTEYATVMPTTGGGTTGDGPPCTGGVITVITNICPIFQTINFGGSVGSHQIQVGTSVEYSTIDTCTGAVTATFCVNNPAGCCPEDGSGSGTFGCNEFPISACAEAVKRCLCLTISGATTTAKGFDISCINGSWPLVWNATYGSWVYTLPLCDGFGASVVSIIFGCLDGFWYVSLFWKSGICAGYVSGNNVPGSQTTSPNTWTWVNTTGTGCVTFGSEDTFTIPSMVLVEDPTDDCGGSDSGSGGGGGCAITSEALGANSVTNSATLSLTGLVLSAGSMLVVNVSKRDANGTDPSVVFAGSNLTVAVSDSIAVSGHTTYGGIFYLIIGSDTAGDITVNTGSGSTTDLVLSAVQLTGLTHFLVDATHFADLAAGSTTPSAGPVTTDTACAYIEAAVVTDGSNADSVGTWGGGFTNGGQDEATIHMILSEGYLITTTAGTYTASKTGITSRPWIALEAAFI